MLNDATKIMGYLLNLVYIRGKFLSRTVAAVLNDAIKRCLLLRNRIYTEYDRAMGNVNDFENMWDAINYHAQKPETQIYQTSSRHHLSRSNSDTSLGIIRDRSFIGKPRPPTAATDENHTKLLTSFIVNYMETQKQIEDAANTTLTETIAHDKDPMKVNAELMSGLQAILKSQEILIRNLERIVDFVEKQNLPSDQRQLTSIKKKISALKQSSRSSLSRSNSAVNDIMEEEITVCRQASNNDMLAEFDDLIQKSRPDVSYVKMVCSNTPTRKVSSYRIPSTQSVRSTKTIIAPVISKHSRLPARSRDKPNYVMLQKNMSELILENKKKFDTFEDSLRQLLIKKKLLNMEEERINKCKAERRNRSQFLRMEARFKDVRQCFSDSEYENRLNLVKLNEDLFHVIERKIVLNNIVNQARKYGRLIESNEQRSKLVENEFNNLRFQQKMNEIMERNNNLLQEMGRGQLQRMDNDMSVMQRPRTAQSRVSPNKVRHQLETLLQNNQRIVDEIEYQKLLDMNLEQFNRFEKRIHAFLARELKIGNYVDRKDRAQLLKINEEVFTDLENTIKQVKMVKSRSETSLMLHHNAALTQHNRFEFDDNPHTASELRYQFIHSNESKTEAIFVKEGCDLNALQESFLRGKINNKFIRFVKRRTDETMPESSSRAMTHDSRSRRTGSKSAYQVTKDSLIKI